MGFFLRAFEVKHHQIHFWAQLSIIFYRKAKIGFNCRMDALPMQPPQHLPSEFLLAHHLAAAERHASAGFLKKRQILQ